MGARCPAVSQVLQNGYFENVFSRMGILSQKHLKTPGMIIFLMHARCLLVWGAGTIASADDFMKLITRVRISSI